MTTRPEFRTLLAAHAEGRALSRLIRYAELLERWSARHNLVRYSNREELVGRHFVESLAAAPLLEGRGQLLDVGSGAGLPGVPLLAVRPLWTGVLLEPRHKRSVFLRTVVRELDLRAEVVPARYDALGPDHTFDAITARAVGDPQRLLEWARDRLHPSGQVVLWTTIEGVSEIASADGWRVLSSQLPGLERGRLARLQPCFT